jgi:hypothetical protein
MKPPKPDVDDIPSPTITRYQQLASDVVVALDALMEEVPKLKDKERRSKAFIRTHIGIPWKFLIGTLAAVEYTPQLERLNQMNVAGAYGTSQLVTAFRPVVSRMATVTDELQLMLDTRQAIFAAEALKIYALVKTLCRFNRDPVQGDVSWHTLKAMKRDLGKGGPRKRKAAAPDATKRKPARRTKPRTTAQRLRRRVSRE